ncbi:MULTISPECIES: YwdI family protein [unclassified Bacillus (in: firmicutes)]|uniref:YwdI family protein n=1 Tax=unclassified Bacillus (in: firmicutes) TaxID=185979 RepID=UPI0008DEC66D|nr:MULTISPECIES: YwdI family protein [unclassified Bacillus (in: firmicutes)]SFB03263.1 hypothetical protein SAMN02799634_104168 [Bacillus sp. UNCCL13]SFQ88843.1 hypothetical protein SAMN04488577_3345 [Bacillus sp. cl95]
MKKLLSKIENELVQAKGSTDQGRLREKVYAMKALCELILDEEANSIEETSVYSQPIPARQMVAPLMPAQPYQGLGLGEPKKLDLQEEANGDSLFDF